MKQTLPEAQQPQQRQPDKDHVNQGFLEQMYPDVVHCLEKHPLKPDKAVVTKLIKRLKYNTLH